MRLHILVLSFITLFPIISFCQNGEKGLILPMHDSLYHLDEYCCVLSPQEGFTVYNLQKERIGKLKKDKSKYNIHFINNSNIKTEMQENLYAVGYEIMALKYKLRNDGFVEIENDKTPLLLNINEIRNQRFRTVPWMKYLIQTSGKVLGYYASEPGLKIRTAPSINSEVIGSVRGDLFEIKLTDDTDGNWCKVIVKKYKEHHCGTDLSEEENIEYTQEGWMKVLDDEGNSNLWNYSKGC